LVVGQSTLDCFDDLDKLLNCVVLVRYLALLAVHDVLEIDELFFHVAEELDFFVEVFVLSYHFEHPVLELLKFVFIFTVFDVEFFIF
jgi:hypothetical protein